MPSEAELVRELNVGRMTLRRALSQLAAEGWIALGGRGCRHRLKSRDGQRPIATGKRFRVLTPYRFSELGSSNHQLLNEAAERLGSAGYHLEIERHPGLFARFDPKVAQRLAALPGTAGWLLLYGTSEIQSWLASLGLPLVTAGLLVEDAPVSAVYPDTQAAGRHATGVMWSRGYRDLVYLVAKVTSVGDRRAMDAFIQEAARLGARARVVEHGGTMESIARAMCALLASRPQPTGFLVGCSHAAITVQACLQHAGIRIPTEAAVISMWHDVFLEFAYPPIARYRTDGRQMGRKAADFLLHQMQHGNGKVRKAPFIPEFIE